MLKPSDARTHYDKLGAGQNRELRYAAPAFDAILRHGRFAEADAVLELGCGTGILARDLLKARAHLSYLGLDIAPAMTRLTRDALRPFYRRYLVAEADATAMLPLANRTVDRVVAAYFLEILPPAIQTEVLFEAARVLRPGGLLCAASLGRDGSLPERMRMTFWDLVHAVAPARVGGCRPIRLRHRLEAAGWRIVHHEAVSAAGLPSDVVIARPPSPDDNRS
ncbi:MAG: class I SAM-dependent methyltransferase [Minwuia sp.]|uniref:class I SAM-dependent methyltransferase n=1 Tax=Minwuia sp. TaxID=2493630 RepID=UPI003A8C3154